WSAWADCSAGHVSESTQRQANPAARPTTAIRLVFMLPRLLLDFCQSHLRIVPIPVYFVTSMFAKQFRQGIWATGGVLWEFVNEMTAGAIAALQNQAAMRKGSADSNIAAHGARAYFVARMAIKKPHRAEKNWLSHPGHGLRSSLMMIG